MRRETISAYLRGRRLEIWPPGRWKREARAKPAIHVITGSEAAKPAIPESGGHPNFNLHRGGAVSTIQKYSSPRCGRFIPERRPDLAAQLRGSTASPRLNTFRVGRCFAITFSRSLHRTVPRPHLNLDNNSLTSYHANGCNDKRTDYKALIRFAEPQTAPKALEEKNLWPRLSELTWEPPILAWR